MSTRPNPTKRALVISGGGSKGAFAGGIAQYLIEEKHRDYQVFAGTSAGSLLIPLLALGEVERIKAVFTAIEQHHIFSICPFRIRRGRTGCLPSILSFSIPGKCHDGGRRGLRMR